MVSGEGGERFIMIWGVLANTAAMAARTAKNNRLNDENSAFARAFYILVHFCVIA